MVDELHTIIDQGERTRSADYNFISSLRELAERYDQPWNQPLLFDDFNDGELHHNPTWQRGGDAFWVNRGIGLRSRLAPDSMTSSGAGAPPRQQSTEEALLGAILGGLGNHHPEPQQQQRLSTSMPEQADLSTTVPVTAAFSITLQLADLGREHRGTFAWGPYQGEDQASGYRLVYQADLRPALKLTSFRRGLSSVIEIYDKGALLTDGANHTITWQRRRNGDMTVLLDGNKIMQARDRSYRNPFTGFVMSNHGGDYVIRSVSILGSSR